MKQPAKRTRQQWIKIIVITLFLLLLGAGTYFAARWILALRDPDRLQWFQTVLDSFGVGGWFVLLAIQYIQIVVAFIPGGPIQIVAGALYGPWLGSAVCLLGTLLASATIFALVSRYGHRVIRFFVGEKDLRQYRFLQDERRLEALVFLLFLIPGTPKDALTYLFALTSLPIGRFLALSIVARLPAMVTSILAGDQVVKGNWLQAGLLFAGVTAISLLGLLLHRKVMRWARSRPREKKI